jgi:hypothetical protein
MVGPDSARHLATVTCTTATFPLAAGDDRQKLEQP